MNSNTPRKSISQENLRQRIYRYSRDGNRSSFRSKNSPRRVHSSSHYLYYNQPCHQVQPLFSINQHARPPKTKILSVFWTHEIGKGFRLTLVVVAAVVSCMVAVPVIVGVWVFCWSDIVHLVNTSALRTTLDWTISGGLFRYISESIETVGLEGYIQLTKS